MCVCVHVVNVCVHCIHVYDVSMCVYCVSEICVVHVHCERVYKRGERNVTTEPRALPPTDHRISEGLQATGDAIITFSEIQSLILR